jgi:hypothetical protein
MNVAFTEFSAVKMGMIEDKLFGKLLGLDK